MKDKRYIKLIKRTKDAARSELVKSSWDRQGLSCQSFDIDNRLDTVPRISYNSISKETFLTEYESREVPLVITDAMDDWKALSNWDLETFGNTYRNEKFKVGEDDDGKSVFLGLKYYLHYALKDSASKTDDSPLYIFDSAFANRTINNSATTRINSGSKASKPTCQILQDYTVPSYFTDDLFQLTGSKRPPFRWIVIGPERSGTGVHIDPLGTSAWNALISGHKRWVLFPPGTPKEIIEPKGLKDHEASTWFSQVYPTLIQKQTDVVSKLFKGCCQSIASQIGMIDLVQHPGEIVFVPGGWAHCVMNLDMAVAVTQNFCSRVNLDHVWLKTRHSRPKLAKRLAHRLSVLGGLEDVKEREALLEKMGIEVSSEMKKIYRDCARRIRMLDTVPPLKRNSSSSDSSSSSSSSSESESDSDSDSDSVEESMVKKKIKLTQ